MSLPVISIYEHIVISVSVHKLPAYSPKNIAKWPKLACGRSITKPSITLAMGSMKVPVYTIQARHDEAVAKILTII